jgi:O-antigen ligase
VRVIALTILVAALAVYAWKDWFRSLCGLVLLMALIQHEDMPKSILGIPGFNPWNVLFLSIALAWLTYRRAQGLTWDLPAKFNVLLLLYLLVVMFGFARAVFDKSHIEGYPTSSLVSEELLNTVKWVLPGLLLYDGCRTRGRLRLSMAALLSMYVMLALQVIKRMPLASALGGAGEDIQRTRLKICSSIGYSAVDLSVMLAGASWAMLAAIPLLQKREHKVLLVIAAGATAFAQALTGGRAGYLAWGVIGLVLCLLRWRKYLIAAPILPIVLFLVFPGAAQRALFGMAEKDVQGETAVSTFDLTSGRLQMWPHVVDKIRESPAIGYGRLAMQRTGLTDFMRRTYGDSEAFPHPHNIYLEWLLDNGTIGFVPVAAFFCLVVAAGVRLFRDADPWRSAVGGVALALVLAQLVGGVGSQHFYPRESTLGMWAAVFLLLRTNIDRAHAADLAHGNYFRDAAASARRSKAVEETSVGV